MKHVFIWFQENKKALGIREEQRIVYRRKGQTESEKLTLIPSVAM
jgi:hypothetical protein